MKRVYLIIFTVLIIVIMNPVVADKGLSVSWDLMAKLNIDTGDMPENLKRLDGKTLEVSGFIVPLELDEYIDQVKEFLLVPDPFSCYHVPPPPLNQIIHVSMKKAIPLDMDYRGVTIKGVFNISQHEYDSKLMSFKMLGKSAKKADIDMQNFVIPDMETQEFIFPSN